MVVGVGRMLALAAVIASVRLMLHPPMTIVAATILITIKSSRGPGLVLKGTSVRGRPEGRRRPNVGSSLLDGGG